MTTRIIMLVWTTLLLVLFSLVATTNCSSGMRQTCAASSSSYFAANCDTGRNELLEAMLTTNVCMGENSKDYTQNVVKLSSQEPIATETKVEVEATSEDENSQSTQQNSPEEAGHVVVKNGHSSIHHHYHDHHHHNDNDSQKGISVSLFFRRKTHQIKKMVSALFRCMGRLGKRLLLRRDRNSSSSSSSTRGSSSSHGLISDSVVADSADSTSHETPSYNSSSSSSNYNKTGVLRALSIDELTSASAVEDNDPATSYDGSAGDNGVLPVDDDIIALNLSPAQLEAVLTSYNALISRGDGIVSKAAHTHFPITQHLVYRYLASEEWHEIDKPELVQQAIVDTINWRYDFGIHKIYTIYNSSSSGSSSSSSSSDGDGGDVKNSASSSTAAASFVELVRSRRAFTQDDPDKKGRCLTYIRMPATIEKDKLSTYLNLVMYTVERADKCSVQCGAGQSVVIIDMSQFAWSMNMPIGYMKEVFQLLSVHYRLRLSKLYILNAGRGFYMAWKAVSGILPATTLAKTEVFGLVNDEVLQKLDAEVGLENIDETFGGKRKFDANNWENNTDQYFSRGYWGQQQQQ